MPSRVGEPVEIVRLLVGPAVAKQPCNATWSGCVGRRDVALEQPLRRVVDCGLGSGPACVGDLLPALESKGTLTSVAFVTFELSSIFANVVANSPD